MVQVDYRGKRGANAGDDFHELWALRHALSLLDPDTDLIAVKVEGVRGEDESGAPKDTWDGVDCSFYYGNDQTGSVEHIVIDQLKYSGANPGHAWTIAQLTRSSNKKQDNSVIARLAKAFAGMNSQQPDLVANGNVVVRLVSNQPIDPTVLKALSGQSTSTQRSNKRLRSKPDYADLKAASELHDDEFELFVKNLDFSECGRGAIKSETPA